jgi:hypothetical protein
MPLGIKEILKTAVKTAIAGSAVGAVTLALKEAGSGKVLNGASLVGGINGDLLDSALNKLGSNLNGRLNNITGIPGIPNTSRNPSNPNSVNSLDGPFNEVSDLRFNNNAGNSQSKAQFSKTLPLQNVLHDYASYNYIWTLSALSRGHLNFPDDSYRKGILGPIILKSASGQPNNRVALSPYESQANPSGKYDYFIDNIRIKGVIGLDKNTGNTNSTGINFTVIEPYSIGLFFQTLQVVASKVDYKNWVEMPVLLRVEFFGHHDYLNQNIKSVSTKYFPLKIAQISMKVTDKGSVYDCTAIPWNERAYSRSTSTIKSDIKCSGRTVQEMLQKNTKETISFQSVINDQLASAALAASQGKNEAIIADKVLILFPMQVATGGSSGSTNSDVSNPQGATTMSNQGGGSNNKVVEQKLGVELEGINYVQNSGVNILGTAEMGFIDQKKAEESFSKDNAVWDPGKKVYVRGDLTITEKSGIAAFKQGQSIPNVINQILLSSDYGRQALDPKNFDSNGFVHWWRIDSQMYMLDGESNMKQTGKYPMLTVFRVIPHMVHHSRFLQSDQTAKSKAIKQSAIKEYNYIYTGKNIDVLDFQINFNASFYTALAADNGKFNKDMQNRSQQAADATKSKPVIEKGVLSSKRIDANGKEYDASAGYAAGTYGNFRVGDPMDKIVQIRNAEIDVGSNQGGTTGEDPGRLAARQFHKAINTIADMVQLQMKILGDPFYMGDSGMGNYSAGDSNIRGLNSDEAINYQEGEVYITVNFRNPIDINYKTGLYDFPSGKVPTFSGLYRVGTVESTFTNGVFSQTLDLLRMPNQTPEGGPDGIPDTALTDQINNFEPGLPYEGILYDDADAGEWN